MFEDVVKGRRSIRRYGDAPIAKEILQGLLDAATWAPSAHNRQPWRFAILQSVDSKERLARAMGDQLRSDRTADGDMPDSVERDVQRSYGRITRAASVVVVCLTMADMDVYPDPRRSSAEHLMAVQGTAMATQNILLAAHSQGLGACWMCGPLFCPGTVREALSLPDDWCPQALVTLGYPKESGKRTERMLVSELVIWA